MSNASEPPRPFPDAREDLERWDRAPDTPQTRSPSYRLAFNDGDFLTRDELRPVRLQLELLKAEMALNERGIVSTIVMLGSARIPDPEHADKAGKPGLARLAPFYAEAREFARLCHRARARLRQPRGRHLHRRRPGHHGGRQPRRARCRRRSRSA